MTAAVHKSILLKISLFEKYIKLKDSVKENETYDKCKYYKNLFQL